ncbi:MAG: PEGA domain-containing protein [Terriglobales bacterium]
MKRFASFFLALFVLLTAAQLAAKDPHPQFNTIVVNRFTNANGMNLSQDLIKYFSDGLCSRLEKEKVADRAVEEGITVAETVAANSLSIEGKFTAFDKGIKFLKPGQLSMEINIYRIGDYALVKNMTAKVTFSSMPGDKDALVWKYLGEQTFYPLKKELRNINLSSIPLGPPVARTVPPSAAAIRFSSLPQGASTTFASVQFSSNPTGAEITIDGNYAGSTPSLIKLKPGTHSVKVAKKGYMPWVRSINTDAGESRNMAADMEKTNQ